MKENGILKKGWNYIVVFVIPWIVLALSFVITNRGMLQGKSLLYGDAQTQILPLFVELWNKIHSGDSLFFSWNSGIGFDFYLNFLYYLVSPLNILVLLLPKAWIEYTVQFVMILKWSMSGVTMTYYFMHTKNNVMIEHRKLTTMILGLGFSMSNVILSYMGYINWGDVIILFPIILLMLERLVEYGEWKKYYIFLVVSMICNFYMSYQVCIFLFIWFLIQLNKNVEHKKKKAFLFVGSSLLATLSSFVMILPGVLGSMTRYSADYSNKNSQVIIKSFLNSFYDYIERLFIFNDDLVNWNSYQPNLFFSSGLLILSILFVTLHQKRDKIKVLSTVVLFLISLSSGMFMLVWHGFAMPRGVFHRETFLFVFVLLYMAMQTIGDLKEVSMIRYIIIWIAIMLAFVISFFNIKEYQDFYCYLITFLMVILYGMVTILYLRKSIQYQHFVVVVSILILAELSSNAFYQIKNYNVSDWNSTIKNGQVSQLVHDLKLNQGERTDLLHCFDNVGMYENVANTNAFISYCNGSLVRLMDQLGFSITNDLSFTLMGSSPLTNMMFNIRYGTSDSAGSFSDVSQIAQKKDVSLYKVERLAGLGYMVDDNVLNWDVEKANDFELQNEFVSCATNEDDIFSIVYPNVVFEDRVLQYNCDEEYLERGYYYYDYICNTVPGTEMTALSFTVDEDIDLYVNMYSQKSMHNMIFVDDENVHNDLLQKNQYYYHLGNLKKGQKVVIYSVHSMEIGEESTIWFRFAQFNEENYAKAYEKLSKNTYQIDEMNSTYVSGTIHADEDGIMMTSIPAMDGFQVYVDGEETTYESVGGALIGVPLRAGDHKVEFKYMTPYFIPGLIGSVAGIMIFVIICIVDAARKKKSLLDDKVEKMQGEA